VKSIPILKKRAPKKKTIVVKDKHEKAEKKCEEGTNSRFNLLQIGPWASGPWTLV
jgi:hypothetical protein